MYWLTNIARILLQECMNQCPRCCVVCAGNWVDTVSLFNKCWRKQTKHIAVTPAKLWLNQGPNVKVWHLDLGSIKVWQVWHCQTAFRLCPLESHLIWAQQMWHCQAVFFFQTRHCQPICRLWPWEIRSIRVAQLWHCKQPADGDFWWTFVQRELGIRFYSVQSASTLLARHLYRISCFKSRLMGASPLSNTETCKKRTRKSLWNLSRWDDEPRACCQAICMSCWCWSVLPQFGWGSSCLFRANHRFSNDVSKDLRHKMCA